MRVVMVGIAGGGGSPLGLAEIQQSDQLPAIVEAGRAQAKAGGGPMMAEPARQLDPLAAPAGAPGQVPVQAGAIQGDQTGEDRKHGVGRLRA